MQRVSENQVAERRTLPSFLYLPGEHELPPGALSLPWAEDVAALVGDYARAQGARVPTRLVSSAKSWLVHPRADRTAPILPWDAAPGVPRVSPVEASARYLLHLREAWNYAHPKDERLQDQEIILCVPASFNEIARELTVQAASLAGLEHVTLLEEPQAAFYSWLEKHEHWQQELREVSGVLVCDIGGGTTDFTLIRVESGDVPVLKRVAVGEHLMLGGDNMDLALAHVLEQALGARFDPRSWGILVHECRAAKERLLAADGPTEFTVAIPGTGSRLLAGMTSAPLLRDDVHQIILDGFFPLTEFGESPQAARRSALAEWGLPYAADPAVSRHLSAFLRNQAQVSDATSIPDAILFNGAALEPTVLRERVRDVLGRWSGKTPRELANRDLDLAVARGAAYFGWVRESGGLRIGGGTARSYYVGVAEAGAACLIPRGLEEGQSVEIREPEFRVVVDRPVSFPLYASSVRHGDQPGAMVAVNEADFETLPPLATVLGTRRRDPMRRARGPDFRKSNDDEEVDEEVDETPAAEIPVHLKARVTEIGTLELWCLGRDSSQKWRLQFQLRGQETPLGTGSTPAGFSAVPTEDPLAVRESCALVARTLRRKIGKLDEADVKPRGLMWSLEERLREKRDDWSLGFLRELWESLDRVNARRRSSPDYEGPWLNMCGFALRPGFGYPLDDWRVNRTFELFGQGLQFPKSQPGRLEWWVLWRRLAGGLDRQRQAEVFAELAPYLLPRLKHVKTRLGPPQTSAEWSEVHRLVASLERIDTVAKIHIGEKALHRLEQRPANLEFWMLARLGARMPFAASPHHCVPPDVAEGWLNNLLQVPWKDVRAAGLAICQVGRLTGDRSRDVSEDARERAALRLEAEGMASLARPLREIVELQADEQAAMVGESIPIGLRLGGT